MVAFRCPTCGTSRQIAYLAPAVRCHACGVVARLKSELERLGPGRCPFCRGEVGVGAAKCLHCGEWLLPNPSPRKHKVPHLLYAFLTLFTFGIFGVVWVTHWIVARYVLDQPTAG